MQLISSEGVKMRRWRVATAAAAALGLVGCHRAAPKGQVVATVGGTDITLQDVRAEGRADGVPESAGPAAQAALLQRVIDRQLLVQAARDQKLDQAPNEPSDLARLQQTWLADKAAKRLLVGLTAPTDAQAQAFMTAHPFAFSKRERVNARTLTLAQVPALLVQLKTFKSFDQAQAFLKRLGVATSVGAGEVDTAQLPAEAAAQLAVTPVGTLLITQPPGRIQLAQVQGHTPVVLSAAEQLNLAKRALANEAASQRISAELAKRKAKTPIAYQPGYAPAAAPSGSTKSQGSGVETPVRAP